MFCTECGKEIKEGDLFCPECGAKLEVDEEPAKTAPAQTFTKAPETPKTANTKALKISLIFGCVVAVVLFVLVILAATKPSIEFLKDTPFSSATSVEQKNDEEAKPDDNENSDESDKSETDKKSEDKTSTDTSKTKTYVLENSSSKELTSSDISGLTDDEICIAQNEIWARHGRKFKNNWLQAYFNKQSWYSGRIEADEFLNEYSPSDVENKNAQFLNSVLSSRGYDLNKVHPN